MNIIILALILLTLVDDESLLHQLNVNCDLVCLIYFCFIINSTLFLANNVLYCGSMVFAVACIALLMSEGLVSIKSDPHCFLIPMLCTVLSMLGAFELVPSEAKIGAFKRFSFIFKNLALIRDGSLRFFFLTFFCDRWYCVVCSVYCVVYSVQCVVCTL